VQQYLQTSQRFIQKIKRNTKLWLEENLLMRLKLKPPKKSMFPLPIGTIIKAAVALVITLVIAGGLWYVTGLRADLAVSQENTRKMTEAVEKQQEVIAKIQAEQEKIKQINNELNTTIKLQNKDMDNLKDRFTQSANGQKRDIGKSAIQKPLSIEKAINRGTVNALRCLEIASGSPLTEAEKNAKLPSEINRECPSIANPNYKPTAGQ
jgi:TolA-binding protein